MATLYKATEILRIRLRDNNPTTQTQFIDKSTNRCSWTVFNRTWIVYTKDRDPHTKEYISCIGLNRNQSILNLKSLNRNQNRYDSHNLNPHATLWNCYNPFMLVGLYVIPLLMLHVLLGLLSFGVGGWRGRKSLRMEEKDRWNNVICVTVVHYIILT